MPKNWKYIKKLLEKEFLCEKLKGHVTYDLTDYRPAPWYQQHFIMKYDDEVLIDACYPDRKWDKKYKGIDINWSQSNLIADRLYKEYGLEKYSVPISVIESMTGNAFEAADKMVSHHNGVFGVSDIIGAIGIYLHSDIETSLAGGQDELIKALAILDRRCGIRRLQKYAEYSYIGYPKWLKRIFQIRFEAEGIRYHDNYNA